MVDTVIIHNPDQLRAVFAAAVHAGFALRAVTAEWAGVAHGALFWAKAVEHARDAEPEAEVAVALHCGDDAARAQAALREGWKLILFSGNAVLTGKIADIAAQCEATLVPEPDDTALDLGDCADVAGALTAWIAARRRCK